MWRVFLNDEAIVGEYKTEVKFLVYEVKGDAKRERGEERN